MLRIFIIILIINILCESHINLYVHMFMEKKYKITLRNTKADFFACLYIYLDYLIFCVI